MSRDARLPLGRLAAEFVVIVVGVLVALSVDAFVQRLEDRERESAYLAALLFDVRASLDFAEGAVEIAEGLRERMGLLSEGLDSRPMAPDDSLALWFEHSLRSPSYLPSAPTADALVETGDISLIQDPALRRRVIAYREVVRQSASWATVFEEAGLDALASINRQVDRRTIARGGEVEWLSLAVNMSVRGDLQTMSITQDARLRQYTALLGALAPLLEHLEREVEGSVPAGAGEQAIAAVTGGRIGNGPLA